MYPVVVLCGSEEFVRDFMLMAHHLDMTNGEYVYVVVDQVPADHVFTPWVAGDDHKVPADQVFTPWVAGDDQDETARLAFESVLQVRVSV